MRVFFSEDQLQHAPERELVRGGTIAYPETPQRARAILAACEAAGGFSVATPYDIGIEALRAIHRPDFLYYLEHVYGTWCASNPGTGDLIPVAFARGTGRRPPRLVDQAGYFCFDSTPIARHTFVAAWASARCALSAAESVLRRHHTAYALCRPPGHHAGPAQYGGYCYLNNAALAAARLRQAGRVAILDIDYHHGNGTQETFYHDADVLFVSLHADPDLAYPFFWGAADELGCGPGTGRNLNIPLAPGTRGTDYLAALDGALEAVQAHDAAYLVLSAGMDTLDGDYWGDFRLRVDDFARIGALVAGLRLPAVVVQEGGYRTQDLGAAAVALLEPMDTGR